jgi:DNA-binding NarL/FixJ family response regulator
VRVVIADDSALLREGLRRLLQEAGHDVVACVGDAAELLAAMEGGPPDLAVIDIRMPPTFTYEGAVAAAEIRDRWPDVAVILLSQVVEATHALELAQSQPRRFGYLLKDRILDVALLTDAITTVSNGGTVLDPEIVSAFFRRRSTQDRTSRLTAREREVLAAMAEGRSNNAIASRFGLSDKTVESHVANIFTKLDLLPEGADHRRVRAVLTWLEEGSR